MMRKLIMAGIAMMTIAISSCDEDTTTLGDSLTSDIDRFATLSQSYRIETKSLRTDSVLASSMFQYLGKINDPETNSYITSDYMTQFNILENESSGIFPKEELMPLDDDFKVFADSCVIRIMVSSFQGDSLSPMKLRLCELAKPVPNGSYYYSDFDPEEEGYLRTEFDESGKSIKDDHDNDISILDLKKSYTVSDLTMSDSLRNVLRGNQYYKYITIPLTQPYTDKEGTTYPGYDAEKGYGSGYGTYLLRTYYEHPEYFKNSHTFARNVCPGFYLKTIDGTGVMLEVANTQIIVYYTYTTKDEVIVSTSRVFMSTDEVLQTNHVVNDKEGIKELEKIDTCTFLKTPSGIFTEVELPIDSIIWLKQKDAKGNELASHVNDTLMSAKITFAQMKAQNELSSKLLEEPTDILMLPLDQLYSFFEKSSMPNNITTYLGTYNSVQKTYSFNTLTGLINSIWTKMKPQVMNADGTVNLQKVENYKKENPNWNKVVLVPVDLTLTSSSNTTSSVSSVFNSMIISSVRLVGGKNNKHAPIKIDVTYSKSVVNK